MNHWLQRKIYQCPACGIQYVHDRAYLHAAFHCPGRQPKTGGQGAGAPASCGLRPGGDGATHRVEGASSHTQADMT